MLSSRRFPEFYMLWITGISENSYKIIYKLYPPFDEIPHPIKTLWLVKYLSHD